MKNSDSDPRYIRWQDYRISQLSFSINLFLGFAIASLGYIINMKLQNGHQVVPLTDVIMVFWLISAILGCAATITRLLDFRYTARKILCGGTFNSFMAKYCGPVTWGCFWGQLILYATGTYLFVDVARNL